MEPIRSRTSPPARARLAASHVDAGQPSADQGTSAPAVGPLDGLPARRTASRTQIPPSPANVPAFSEGSFGDLLQQMDLSFFEAFPSFNTQHAEAAPGALEEVQSALYNRCTAASDGRIWRLAADCHPNPRHCVGGACGSKCTRLQPASTGKNQTAGARASGTASPGADRPWVYPRAHRGAQQAPASAGNRGGQVSSHHRDVAGGHARRHRRRR